MVVESKTDLLIVGGGVIGAFHAWHALQRGLTVTLLERNAAPRGATVRNFGQVVPSGMDRHWQVFGRESLEIYRAIQQQADITVRQNGSIYLASDDEELTLLEELREINAADDYSSQLLTAAQCREKYTQLRADYCRGGLFFPDEVSVNPRLMIHRLHRFMSQQAGYVVHFNASVTSLNSENGNVVAKTADGRWFHAAKAMVCSGGEFKTLYPELFDESDLTAVKLQMLRLAPQPSVCIPGNVLTGLSIRRYECFSQCPSWSEIKSREPGESFWKSWGVHILFKQEPDGSIILGDSHEYAPAASADDLGFDLRGEINEYFIAEGQKIFELPRWDIEAAWFGVYCQTKHPSGVFRHTIDDNIHIVTGIGGKGMTSSAAFAKHNLSETYND